MTKSPQGSQTQARAPGPRDLLGLVVTLCSSEGSKAVTHDESDRSASQQRTLIGADR
jgi:hypothetical protein